MRQSVPNPCDLRDPPVTANAHGLLSADVDRLYVRPRSIDAKNREARHTAIAFVARAGEISLRVQLSSIGGPLCALSATTLRVTDRMLDAVSDDRESLPACESVRRDGLGRVAVSRAFSTTSSQQPSHAFHFGSAVCWAFETRGNNNTAEAKASFFIALLLG